MKCQIKKKHDVQHNEIFLDAYLFRRDPLGFRAVEKSQRTCNGPKFKAPKKSSRKGGLIFFFFFLMPFLKFLRLCNPEVNINLTALGQGIIPRTER